MTAPAEPTDPASSQPDAARRRPGREDHQRARAAARLGAVQAVYQMELTGAGWQDVRREFETYRLGAEIDGVQYHEADVALFRALLEAVVARQSEIDRLSDAAIVDRWPLDRVDPTLRALFRCGGAELLTRAETPARVVVSQYVDIAGAFFPDGREPRFANAVLDHMARMARPGEMGAAPGS